MNIFQNILPQTLFHGESKYNNNIEVIKVGKTNKLIVNGIVQSFSKNSKFAKGKVWGQIVKVITKNNQELNSVLLLGMGAGTMLHSLQKTYPNCSFTSVEIDQTIVDLAYKYFDLAEITNNQVLVADAMDVVLNPQKYNITKKFDCIILDTYIGGALPTQVAKKEFIDKAFELAEPGAFVIINRIVYKDRISELEELEAYLNKHIQKLNQKIIKYPSIADNYILYGRSNIT